MGTKNVTRQDANKRFDRAVVECDEEEITGYLGNWDKRTTSPSGYSDNTYPEEDSLFQSFTTSAGGATNIVQMCQNKVNILR